jgi:hypothetical protein
MAGMKVFWKILELAKIVILVLAAAASALLRKPFPLLILAAGLLCMNALGLGWGLDAGARVGAGKAKAVLLTMLRGSSWWAPILAEPPAKRDAAEATTNPDRP